MDTPSTFIIRNLDDLGQCLGKRSFIPMDDPYLRLGHCSAEVIDGVRAFYEFKKWVLKANPGVIFSMPDDLQRRADLAIAEIRQTILALGPRGEDQTLFSILNKEAGETICSPLKAIPITVEDGFYMGTHLFIFPGIAFSRQCLDMCETERFTDLGGLLLEAAAEMPRVR